MSSAQDSTGESKIVSASSRIELQAHPLLHTALHNFVKSEKRFRTTNAWNAFSAVPQSSHEVAVSLVHCGSQVVIQNAIQPQWGYLTQFHLANIAGLHDPERFILPNFILQLAWSHYDEPFHRHKAELQIFIKNGGRFLSIFVFHVLHLINLVFIWVPYSAGFGGQMAPACPTSANWRVIESIRIR